MRTSGHSRRSLDLRGVSEPVQRAIEAAQALGPNEELEVVTAHEHIPLQRELTRHGFRFSCKAERGGFYTTVRKP